MAAAKGGIHLVAEVEGVRGKQKIHIYIYIDIHVTVVEIGFKSGVLNKGPRLGFLWWQEGGA